MFGVNLVLICILWCYACFVNTLSKASTALMAERGDSINCGVNPVEPGLSNAPPERCILLFESPSLCSANKKCRPKAALMAESGDSLNYGVNAVEPALSNAPQERCILLFESPPLYSAKKKCRPKAAFLFGGECEIRTHGGSPHHQFSRLAP